MMLRRARVPMPAATAAARPRRGPLPKKAKEAGALRLFRAATDAVLYGFLAAVWAKDFVGTAVEILGRWVCGEGSAVQAVGVAVRACCMFFMVLLFPSFLPLVMMRVRERAKLALKEEEEEREKLASNHNVMVGSVNEQLPKKNRAGPRFPKGVKVTPLYAFLPIVAFVFLATMMQLHQEEGSLMWRLAEVLFDVAHLGFAVIVGVWVVRNAVILVTLPKAKDGDD